MKRLLVLVFLLVGCGFAGNRGYDWYNYQVNVPVSSQSETVKVHVDPGESTTQIANDLATKGLIRQAEVLLVYLRYGSGQQASIQAGDFVLNRNMSMAQLVNAMGHARLQQVSVTLPEGTTMKVMAPKVEQAGIGKAADYLAAAQDPAAGAQYDFLANRPANAPQNLEGFLFPDTYQLNRGNTAQDLVKRQLGRFGQQVTPDMRAAMAQPAPGRPAESLFDIITLASIVEREVFKDPDRAIVCGIFYNRLAARMALQDDVTVLYGLNKPQGPLTDPEKQKDTPFNTYLHPGLPAGPISNPGLASINACITQQKTDYLFFFADAKGVTRYAKTYAEHNRQQALYGLAPG
ncbi:MAG TPA: endolytic transglycosylase MltG [Candidatus Dormibacteraeota bacterium]